MDKANWDAYHTKIFCEICKEETEKHNRPGGYLSPKGYNNLEEKFFQLTKKRRTRRQFKNKCDQLKKQYARFMALKHSATGLGWNDKMGTIEAMFLWIVGAPQSFSQVENCFARSTETIHRKFKEVLDCLCKLASNNIKPTNYSFSTPHERIKDDRFWPHFEGAIGAIDGSHI